MERLQIRLNTAERAALARAAWARRRQPRELVEVLLRQWLVRKGYLDDPTAAGKLRTLKGNADSAKVSQGGRAVGQ